MTTPVETEPEPSTSAWKIELESALSIHARSYGEIRTPQLFDFKLGRFHADGLFSETIFGPVADYCCACGSLAGSENFGRVCEKCSVQIRSHVVRGERAAHINLPLPILHPWFWGHDSAPAELLLELSHKQLKSLLSRRRFVQPGTNPPRLRSTASSQAIGRLGCQPTFAEFVNRSGALAVQTMLESLSPSTIIFSWQKRASARRDRFSAERGELLRSVVAEHLAPTKLMLEAVPVLPPWLRSIRLAADGSIEVDPVTASYQRIVRSSQAVERCLVRMQSCGDEWPDQQSIGRLVRRERRLAWEVARLFEDLLRRRPAPLLKSREREVVVPDPTLPLYACRLPVELAAKLTADDSWSTETESVAGQSRQLESEISKRPVILRLADSEMSADVVALHPRVSADRAIHVHPLLALTFERSTADLAASMHALSWLESEEDCDRISFPTIGFRDAVFGKCRLFPKFDAAVGCYYATWLAEEGRKLRDMAIAGDTVSRAQIPTFACLEDVRDAWERGRLQLRNLVGIRLAPEQKLYRKIRDREDLRDGKPRAGTTVGRAIVNSFLPPKFPYFDVEFDLGALRAVVQELRDVYGNQDAERFVERATAFGLHVVTRSGLSLSQSDLLPPPSVARLVEETRKEITRARRLETRGIICPTEAWSKIYELAEASREKSLSAHFEAIVENDAHLHPLMATLKGTGKYTNAQLIKPVGIIGNVWTPWARNFPTPILRNINQGLNLFDYFRLAAIDRHQQVDALQKPAAPRRLQRRIAAAIGDVVISEEDCGTQEGVVLERWQSSGEEKSPPSFADRVVGRVIVRGLVYFSEDGFGIPANDLISPQLASKIDRSSYNEIKVRSPLYCRARQGICRRCYGADPATGKLIELGAAIGVKAALAMGPALGALHDLLRPPPADAMLREFSNTDRGFAATQKEGVVSLRRLRVAIDRSGQRVVVSPGGVIEILANGTVVDTAWVAHGALVTVAAGAQVSPNDNLAKWDIERQRLLAQDSGRVRLEHQSTVELGYQLLTIHNAAGLAVDGCFLPADATLHVRDADQVEIGALLAEYDRPEDPGPDFAGNHFQQLERLLTLEPPAAHALLAEVDGRVELSLDTLGVQCEIRIHANATDEPTHYYLPLAQIRDLLARTGQIVANGDPLTRGKVSLAGLVRARGTLFVQSQLLASINRLLADLNRERPADERPWELLVSQMLRFVRVESRGDTTLDSGAVMPRSEVMATNSALAECVKIPDVKAYPIHLESNIVSRDVYLNAEAERQIVDPQSPPPGVSVPWPAGWSSMLLGIDDLARRASWITTDGVRLNRDALVRAAITGQPSRVDRFQETFLSGGLMPAGSGWNRNDP